MSFEKMAKQYGLARARRLWKLYELKIKMAEAQAAKMEQQWAAQRHRTGNRIIVKNDLDMYPTVKMAPYTYKALWRSTLNQRGCTGGEALFDEEYMRDFLKRNPECAAGQVVAKDIQSGWSRAQEANPLERAAKLGKMERAAQHVMNNHRLQAAAAEGKSKLIA